MKKETPPFEFPEAVEAFPYTYFVFQEALRPDDFVENVLPDVGIHGRQGVIQQVNVSVGIDGPGQADPLLLAA